MAGRKSIIAAEESAPPSPLRRSSRISTSSATAPITGRRSSATAVETATPAKLGKGKRSSLSQDISEEKSDTPKRTIRTTRAASKSPTSVAENDSKTVGTPAKRGRRSSIAKTEEDKAKSSTPTTVAGRRRSVRGQSTSPTSDKAEAAKPRGRRISVTEKIAPLVPIEESEEVKKPATRARRTSLTSRRASVEESNESSSLDKRVLTVQLTQLDVEVKKTTRTRGRPSKVAVDEVDQKKNELNPIIETSFTEESEVKVLSPIKKSPKKSPSKSPKKSVSGEKSSPKVSPDKSKAETPVKGSPKKLTVDSPKKIFDTEIEEENFDLVVEDEVLKEKSVDECNSKIEEKITKDAIEIKESVLSSEKDMIDDKETKESVNSPRKELNNSKIMKSPKTVTKIEETKEDEMDKPQENKVSNDTKSLEDDKGDEIDLLKFSENTSESINTVSVSKGKSKSPEKSRENSKLAKSSTETVNVLTPITEKLKDDSSFKSPRTSKRKTDDSFLVNPLEMSLGSDGSFHLHLSLPESNNSREKNESKLEDNEKLNTTGGSDNSDKENLGSPLNSTKQAMKTPTEVSVFSIHSVEDKKNTSTPKICLNSSKSKGFIEDVEVKDSNLDSSITKSMNEQLTSSARKSLGRVSKLMEEEEEFCSSPVKKIKPIKTKDQDKSLAEDIFDSFVDEVNDVEDLNEEEISKILQSPPNVNKSKTRLSNETEKTSQVTEIVDVETAVAIIKESPKTKRLSLKLKHSTEESLLKEIEDDLEDDKIMDASNIEKENLQACNILQSSTTKNRDNINNVKDVIEMNEISDKPSTPEKTKDVQQTPATTSSKKKKRMSKKIEQSSDSFTELNDDNGVQHQSPAKDKMKSSSPKLDKTSNEQNMELAEIKSNEEPNSLKRSAEVEKKINDEAVVVIDDDDIKVSKTPKRKSLKLKSSTEDLAKAEQEISIESDECSMDICKSAKKSRKEKRKSKKLLDTECSKNPDEVIEINEDSSENQMNVKSDSSICKGDQIEIEEEESNDVEFVNEKVVEKETHDDVEFVKNISPNRKSKKDKRKSKSLEIAENITGNESKQINCEVITITSENIDLEQPPVENETIDMVSEESNDIEIINAKVAPEKSPNKYNKGSKRIKRDIESVSDDTIAIKTEDPGLNKLSKEKRKSEKQNSEENPIEKVEEICENTQSAKKKRESLKKTESAEIEGCGEQPIQYVKDICEKTPSAKKKRESLKKTESSEKEVSEENAIEEVEEICKNTQSAKKKRESLKKTESAEKEGCEEQPIQYVKDICEKTPSAKKKRESLKKTESSEKEVSEENAVEEICEHTQSAKKKRESLKKTESAEKEGCEEQPIQYVKDICEKTPSAKKKRKSLKKTESSEKEGCEENPTECIKDICKKTLSAKKKRESLQNTASSEIESCEENAIEEVEDIRKETESAKKKRKSLKIQEIDGLEKNAIAEDSPICKGTESAKKKRKSIKKQESAVEDININEAEITTDTNKEKSPAKLCQLYETRRSKRLKISHEDDENMESSNLGMNASPVKSNTNTDSINDSNKKTPKKEQRKSKKQQIENDLFGDDPVNKEEIVDASPSQNKLNQSKQKTAEYFIVKKQCDVESNDGDSSEDERLDSTINDLIKKKHETKETEMLENDNNDEDFAPSCDFLDEEAMEGSPESSPSHSNDIIDEGESLHSSDTEEESDLFDEDDYENDSFIDDDECGELLSGNEYDLSDEKIKKKKVNEKTKKKSKIIVVSDSEEDTENEDEEKTKDEEAKTVSSENKGVISDAENITSEENKKINIIQNIVISPQNQKSQDGNEESENNEVEQKPKVETKILTDTPNNSFADTTTSSTKRNKSKRKTSISIQEKLSLTSSTDIEINEKISKAVDFFCSSIKDKVGNVSLNVSLDYANNSNSSEDAEEKRINKKKINVQEVVPSISAFKSDENVLKSKKRHSLQDQFTILSGTPEIKRRRSVLPEFTISENINQNKRKSVDPSDVGENKKSKIVEELKKSKKPLAEADSVHETKVKKLKKTIQPCTNYQYLPEDVLVAIVNSSPKVSSSEISESKNTNIIKKKKVRIAPSVKMNQHTDWEIDEVTTKPSKKNKKSEQKLNTKLRQLTETFPSNDFKNRTLYNPKRNHRQYSNQILANKRF